MATTFIATRAINTQTVSYGPGAVVDLTRFSTSERDDLVRTGGIVSSAFVRALATQPEFTDGFDAAGTAAAAVAAQAVVDSGTYAPVGGYAQAAGNPLTVPTYDDNTSTTHPMVIDTTAEGGAPWHGYRYWMAHTPYPDASRENPSIVASNDGVHWVTPSGVSNPVAPITDATGRSLSFLSDPYLVYDAAAGRMDLYYRGYKSTATKREAILLRSSSDGFRTVSASSIVLDVSGDDDTILSPSIVRTSATDLTMWSVNDNSAAASRLERRTSTDNGTTWSGASTCTLPAAAGVIWHGEVRRTSDSVYHLFATIKTTWEACYLRSSDGITWTGNTDSRLARSGQTWDTRGFYKGTAVPRAGIPRRWDVWVSGTDGTGADTWADNHRIGFLPDAQIDTGTLQKQNDRMFIAANMFTGMVGPPTIANSGNRYVYMSFDAATQWSAGTMFPIPSQWQGMDVSLWWTSIGSAGGNVRWALALQPRGNGASLGTDSLEVNYFATAASPGNLVVRKTTIASGIDCYANAVYQVRVLRVAADAADTATDAAGLLGIMFERTA